VTVVCGRSRFEHHMHVHGLRPREVLGYDSSTAPGECKHGTEGKQ